MTDETFLSRWSRLKRRSAEAPVDANLAEAPPVHPPAERQAEPGVPSGAGPAHGEPAPAVAGEGDDPLKDLPPVETLTAESDFTPFLRAEVPEDVHRQALRKLWASDPVFANDDGLKDYAGDYTGLFSLPEPVKTLYRVGKGFLDAAEEAAEKAEKESVPDAIVQDKRLESDAQVGEVLEDDGCGKTGVVIDRA